MRKCTLLTQLPRANNSLASKMIFKGKKERELKEEFYIVDLFNQSSAL